MFACERYDPWDNMLYMCETGFAYLQIASLSRLHCGQRQGQDRLDSHSLLVLFSSFVIVVGLPDSDVVIVSAWFVLADAYSLIGLEVVLFVAVLFSSLVEIT